MGEPLSSFIGCIRTDLSQVVEVTIIENIARNGSTASIIEGRERLIQFKLIYFLLNVNFNNKKKKNVIL